MAEPWLKYQSRPSSSRKPWEKYRGPHEAESVTISPRELGGAIPITGMEITAKAPTPEEIDLTGIAKTIPQAPSIPGSYSGPSTETYGGYPQPIGLEKVPGMVAELTDPRTVFRMTPIGQSVGTVQSNIENFDRNVALTRMLQIAGGDRKLLARSILQALNETAGLGMGALMTGTPIGATMTGGMEVVGQAAPDVAHAVESVLSPFTSLASETPLGREMPELLHLGDLATQILGFSLLHRGGRTAIRESWNDLSSQAKVKLREKLSEEITTRYKPEELREIYQRVNRGQASPEEVDFMQTIGTVFERPGEVYRKGLERVEGREYRPGVPEFVRRRLGEIPKEEPSYRIPTERIVESMRRKSPTTADVVERKLLRGEKLTPGEKNTLQATYRRFTQGAEDVGEAVKKPVESVERPINVQQLGREDFAQRFQEMQESQRTVPANPQAHLRIREIEQQFAEASRKGDPFPLGKLLTEELRGVIGDDAGSMQRLESLAESVRAHNSTVKKPPVIEKPAGEKARPEATSSEQAGIPGPVEQQYRATIEQAGARYDGVQKDKAGNPRGVLFTDPRTGSTLMLDIAELTPERIRQHMEQSRAGFRGEPPKTLPEKAGQQELSDVFPETQAKGTGPDYNRRAINRLLDAGVDDAKIREALNIDQPLIDAVRAERESGFETRKPTSTQAGATKYSRLDPAVFPTLSQLGRGSIVPEWVIDPKTGKPKMREEYAEIDPYLIDQKRPTVDEVQRRGQRSGVGGIDQMAADLGYESGEVFRQQLLKELDQYRRGERGLPEEAPMTPAERAEATKVERARVNEGLKQLKQKEKTPEFVRAFNEADPDVRRRYTELRDAEELNPIFDLNQGDRVEIFGDKFTVREPKGEGKAVRLENDIVMELRAEDHVPGKILSEGKEGMPKLAVEEKPAPSKPTVEPTTKQPWELNPVAEKGTLPPMSPEKGAGKIPPKTQPQQPEGGKEPWQMTSRAYERSVALPRFDEQKIFDTLLSSGKLDFPDAQKTPYERLAEKIAERIDPELLKALREEDAWKVSPEAKERVQELIRQAGIEAEIKATSARSIPEEKLPADILSFGVYTSPQSRAAENVAFKIHGFQIVLDSKTAAYYKGRRVWVHPSDRLEAEKSVLRVWEPKSGPDAEIPPWSSTRSAYTDFEYEHPSFVPRGEVKIVTEQKPVWVANVSGNAVRAESSAREFAYPTAIANSPDQVVLRPARRAEVESIGERWAKEWDTPKLKTHRQFVEEAKARGENVPPEVREEYPDLFPKPSRAAKDAAQSISPPPPGERPPVRTFDTATQAQRHRHSLDQPNDYVVRKTPSGKYGVYETEKLISEPPRLPAQRETKTPTLEEQQKGTMFEKERPEEPDIFGSKAQEQVIPKEMEPPKPSETVKASSIIDKLSKAFQIPIRIGHRPAFLRKHTGLYSRHNEAVRLREANDLATASHEVAHHIQKVTLGSKNFENPRQWKEYADELRPLDYDQKKRRLSEGFAEFVRHYLTTDEAQERAPKFYKHFTEEFLPSNPHIAKTLSTAREQITQWREQGAEARILSQIDFGEARPNVAFGDKYRHFKLRLASGLDNQLAPLNAAVKEMMERANVTEIEPRLDPRRIASAVEKTAPGKARAFVMDGAFDFQLNKVGKSLREIVEPVRNDASIGGIQRAIAYAYARRAQVLHERGINPGIAAEDAAHFLKKHANPKLDTFVKELTEWSDHLLKYLVDGGALSEQAAAAIRQSNMVYIPLKRAFVDELGARGGGVGRGYVNLGSPVKRIKGSGREIVNPLESMVQQAEQMISVADKARVARALVEAAEKMEGVGKWVEKVDAPKNVSQFSLDNLKSQMKGQGLEIVKSDLSGREKLKPEDLEQIVTLFSNSNRYTGKDNIVSVYRDGKREFYELHPDLYQAMRGLDKVTLPWFVDATFGRAARGVRLGATGIRAGFTLITNPIRDAQTFILQSDKSGILPNNVLRGYQYVFGKGEPHRMFKAAGGEMAQPLGLDRKMVQNLVEEALATNPKEKGKLIVHHPIEALREVMSFTEAAPRLAEFDAVMKKWQPKIDEALKAGDAERVAQLKENAAIEAANAAADVTVNFRRMGTYSAVLNQVIPFFNPTIQGVTKMGRTVAAHPVRSGLRATATLTAPTLALWYVNKDEDWYKELPDWQRYGFWNFKIGDTLVRLPKPFEWGYIFAGIPEGVANALYQENPERFKEALKAAGENLVPDVTPALIKPGMEAYFNWDMFRERPIVPKSQEDLLPSEQYSKYTSSVAKEAGKILGVSPAKIDHLLSGYSGGLATDILHAVPQTEYREPSQYPIIGRLFTRSDAVGLGGKSVSEFYDLYEKATRYKRTLDRYLKVGPGKTATEDQIERGKEIRGLDPSAVPLYQVHGQLERVAQRLKMLRDRQRKIDEMDLDPGVRKQLSDAVQAAAVQAARRAVDATRQRLDTIEQEDRSLRRTGTE